MSWTVIIIVITVLASASSFNKPGQLGKLMMNPSAIVHRGQWYRMITSGFIHANWMHLAFNMFTFYFFGQLVEQTFMALKGPAGQYYFLGFYLFAIVISDLPSVFKHKDNPGYNSLGASGGVAAAVFSSILFYPTNPIYLFAAIPIPGFILGALYLIYSYTKGRQMSDNINHDAHLIGAVFGFVFSLIIEPGVLWGFFRQIGNWSPF